ncbi:unnamed protein product, partial [Citrullus colocynthis]
MALSAATWRFVRVAALAGVRFVATNVRAAAASSVKMVKVLVDHLAAVGVKINDEVSLLDILNGLLIKFNVFRISIRTRDTTPSLAKLEVSLDAEAKTIDVTHLTAKPTPTAMTTFQRLGRNGRGVPRRGGSHGTLGRGGNGKGFFQNPNFSNGSTPWAILFLIQSGCNAHMTNDLANLNQANDYNGEEMFLIQDKLGRKISNPLEKILHPLDFDLTTRRRSPPDSDALEEVLSLSFRPQNMNVALLPRAELVAPPRMPPHATDYWSP